MKTVANSGLRSLLGIDNTLLLWMLWFIPLSCLAEWRDYDPLWIFTLSGLAIVPLAAMIAHATENVAATVGSATGGLLNATFGNATEMVISIVALSQGLVEVVKASITGTIIANLLLALGAGMLLGGLRHPEQEFKSKVARINASSLTLALVVMLTPSAIQYTSKGLPAFYIDHFSLVAAGLLLSFYLLSLLFSMKTHRHFYETDLEGENGEAAVAIAGIDHPTGTGKHIAVLLASSVVLVFVSEILVSSLESAIKTLGLTQLFTGVILIALFGGAVEYI
ncbi:MAG: calcium/proton exchanger, partial [Candidatus Methylumidiphilus sp.]